RNAATIAAASISSDTKSRASSTVRSRATSSADLGARDSVTNRNPAPSSAVIDLRQPEVLVTQRPHRAVGNDEREEAGRVHEREGVVGRRVERGADVRVCLQ